MELRSEIKARGVAKLMAKRDKLYKDSETGLVRRSHPDEPIVKKGEDTRRYWRVMEIIPDTGKYTAYCRLDALIAYAALGNMKQVCAALERSGHEVKYETVLFWKNSTTWWKPALHEVREMMGEELDARQTKILNAIYDGMEERLENGDEVITKDGDRVRKRVGFRDLAIGGGVMFDKRQLGRGEATARVEQISDKDRLDNLQKKFKKIARTDERVVEGEFEVVHD